MRITRSLPAIIAALLITAVPLAAPAQFSIGVGFTVGAPPPALPYYSQPPAPYPNYQWTPGYWAYGSAGYYWVPGVWVAPPSVGLYWTPGYWGYSGGGYGWNAGYWGASVGFYGGINYGYGYPGSGFYGGAWNGGAFRYNTAVVHVNRTTIHNTYNKTVVNKNVCNNCKNVSFNGGKGGVSAKPTSAQMQARRNGRAPTTAQRDTARVAGQDRNQLASVNKGKPSLTASDKPLNDNNKPKNFAPVTSSDRANAQKNAKSNNAGANQGKVGGTNTSGNKGANKNKTGSNANAGNKGTTHGNNPPSGGQNKHKQPPSSGGNAMQSQGGGHRQGGGGQHQGGGKHNQGQPPGGQGGMQGSGRQGGGGQHQGGGGQHQGGGGGRQGGGGGGGGKQGKPPSA